ncbi:MAG TPA: response regulator transcription factor [Terriglobales bacterium]|jgi:DNA-binding response OmpR family regulator|nr:response regulator transcription factor [Terriglobales bacterium]
MSRVLVVEDEAHLAQGLRFNLQAEGHAVEVASDGETALEQLLEKKERFDAVVLDVMLPGKSGFDVASVLRAKKNYVPILMLTARGRPEDVLQGFASGADDYLPKPFELAILIARLESLLRRSVWMKNAEKKNGHAFDAGGGIEVARKDEEHQTAAGERGTERDVFTFAGKSIDFAELELRSLGNTIHLTVMEAEFLRYLVESAGRVVSRKAILEDVWGLHEDTDTRAIDNFVVRLRRYIEEDPARPKHLLTVRGVGYRFVAEPE